MTDNQRTMHNSAMNMLTYELARRDARNRVLLILAAVAYVMWYALGNVPIDVWPAVWQAIFGRVTDAASAVLMHIADVVLDRVVLANRG